MRRRDNRSWSELTRRTRGSPSGVRVHGWIDLDPTNDVLPSMRHITLAWGRDYGDVSPLRGVVLGGQEHRLKVEVSVYPLSA